MSTPVGPAPELEESVALPDVSYVHGPTPTEEVYCHLLGAARSDIAVFNRPPYAWVLPALHPAILDLLGRGVPTRVIYRHCDLEGPAAANVRAETEAYIAAGAQARVIDHLPTKLVVMDRRAALVAVPDLLAPEATFPSSLHVEHPGLAGRLAGVFDEYWEAARPYGTPPGVG